MILVTPNNDPKYISSILSDESIYAGMCDDSCPKNPKDVKFPDRETMGKLGWVCLEVSIDNEPAGVFMFIPVGQGVFEGHTALLPNCHGAKAVMAARLGISWLFNNLPCEELVSHSWSDEPKVAMFARIVGLHERSRVPNKFTRNGQPVDRINFVVTKSEWSQGAH